MNKEFTRETRYVVLKNADIMQCLTIKELIELRYIQARVREHRAKLGKPRLDCVVVEADWPEYEPTWKAIEARMMGSLKESAVQTAAQVMDIELIRERDDLRAENDELRKALAQKVTSETMLRDLSVGNGSINASFEGGAPEAKSEFKKRFASPPRSMIEDSVKEAGISDAPFDFQIVSLEDLERFAAIISKHERDACYEIAQSELRNMSALMSNPPKSAAAWEIARRIQARNNL